MRRSKKTFVVIFAMVVLGVVLLGYRNFLPSKDDGPLGRVPCNNTAIPDPEELHIHPELKIVINGEPVVIPVNEGLSFTCHRVIHTHDDVLTVDGFRQIHVEPDFAQDFTLSDFFAVWKRPFSGERILDSAADDTYEIVMTVDGVPSSAYGSLLLRDKQKILIEYKKVVQ